LTKQGVIFRLMGHAGKYKYFMVMSWVFSAVSAIFSLGPYICVYFVASHLLTAWGNPSLLDNEVMARYGWLAVKTTMISFMFYGFALFFSHLGAFNLMANVRIKLVRRLGSLPLGFHAVNPSGKLRKIIEKNAESMENYIAHQLPDTVQAVVLPLAFLVSMFTFDWRLALACLLPVLLGFVALNAMLRGESGGFLAQYQQSLEDMSNAAVEYVRGISVVKVFGQTVFSFKRFHEAITTYKTFVTKYALSMERPMSFYISAVHGIFFALIPAGIVLFQLSQSRERFLFSFVFFVVFTPLAAVLLMRIMYSSSNRMIATQALDRVEFFLNEQPMDQPVHPRKPSGFDIVFDSVSFKYTPDGPLVLDDLSFQLKSGTITAFVGPSGGGKSTVVNLISRFWDVQHGSIRIGGVDVKEMDYAHWMDQVSFVFQDVSLFKMTIAENVAFNKPDATEDEIRRALTLAQCNDIIDKLPRGIHTKIGTEGVYISGGEMQRIALARAILKDAPVVILDEATAFADSENEHKIQKALNVLLKGKTVIMIAHRLSTVTGADQIVVLKDGRIGEAGSHGQLMRRSGMYAAMFNEYQLSTAWKIGGEAHA